MDDIELGIPATVVEKSRQDIRIADEDVRDTFITPIIQFLRANINTLDAVIISLVVFFNFLPMMMGYTYLIDTDSFIDDDARVTDAQFNVLYESTGLKVALTVSVVSSSILLLNNWELISMSNQTKISNKIEDMEDSLSTIVEQSNVSLGSFITNSDVDRQNSLHFRNTLLAIFLLVPDLYLLVIAIPLHQVDFIHALLPARDTVYVFFFIQQLKQLSPQIWTWRVHSTISYPIAVCNLLINLGIFIESDVSTVLIVLVSIALFDISLTTFLFFWQFKADGLLAAFELNSERSEETVICAMYSILLIVYMVITWYVVYNTTGSCFYTCLMGEGYFIIYTYLITFISVIISVVTSHISRRRFLKVMKDNYAVEVLASKMLPASKMENFKRTGQILPELHQNTCLFFSDIEGFTAISSKSQPYQVMLMLNRIYTLMDHVAIKFPRLYKVETIGDAYVIASGLFKPDESQENVVDMANFALIVREVIKLVISPVDNITPIQIRIGVHSGDVLSGVVGNLMPRWCLFGDTMNFTSRLESSCETGKIHVSIAAAKHLKKSNLFKIRKRGLVSLKGKGDVVTYYLESASDSNTVSNEHAIATILEECRLLLVQSRLESRRHGGKIVVTL